MKDIVNEKGFTLVEVLAVIVILGIIVLISFTDVLDFLNIGKERSLEIQKNNIKEAAQLYLKDSCEYPMDGYTCSLTGSTMEDGFISFYGDLSLEQLENTDYIEKVYFRGKKCVGNIHFDNSEVTVTLNCNSDS